MGQRPDALVDFEHVMRVRELALSRFSLANIRRGLPVAGLHEVLAPVYLFHRYQTEAVSKSLGGIDYRFAVRGDGQMIWRDVEPEVQRKALAALLSTLEPEILALPEHILELLPESDGGGETFPSRARPNFDPLAVAETAAQHSLGFLLDANRSTRLLTQHARNPQSPSLNHVLDSLLAQTWRQDRGDGYLDEIGRVVDTVALQRLMALASNTDATTQVRAIANLKLTELKSWLEAQWGESPSEMQRAHRLFGSQQISQYQKQPAGFETTQPAAAPPGAPIGMGEQALPGMICDWGCSHQ